MKEISLSPSKLGDFNRCPRCFHDAYASKCPKPRGIFPGLPAGMDGVIKTYFDIYRGSLPPELAGKVKGRLFHDQEVMKAWRNWRTGLTYIDDKNAIKLIGALDDCLEDSGLYIPLDYKTKGKLPEDDGSQYYQTQMDCYNLMLEANGRKTCGLGYLVYFYPIIVQRSDSIRDSYLKERLIGFDFGVKPFEITCRISHAKELIIKAAECLRGKRPQSSSSCEHCSYLHREDLLTKEAAKDNENN